MLGCYHAFVIAMPELIASRSSDSAILGDD
jgi:hypothetical protein